MAILWPSRSISCDSYDKIESRPASTMCELKAEPLVVPTRFPLWDSDPRDTSTDGWEVYSESSWSYDGQMRWGNSLTS